MITYFMKLDNSADIWNKLEALFPLCGVMWDVQGGPNVLKERTPEFFVYPNNGIIDLWAVETNECIASYIDNKWHFVRTDCHLLAFVHCDTL
jgi:hypothetical protein